MIKNSKSGLEAAQKSWGRFNYLSCLWGRCFFLEAKKKTEQQSTVQGQGSQTERSSVNTKPRWSRGENQDWQ